ncbi:uncharacterized protein LY79DRAFT_538968 [Colletotrichum navitas]|uniref:Secreted protein n=1 Tax=Colletotrichum navitas TaxID=681940 RepID=A0AAD8QBQ0_9PEZI|nr:uncharacterized protein LY79DRAFT_538968 [Colletotrichum navitas]KAK1598363.1 hypothetical protein LY79DRAFT_538968 [Colletotrichum navitas]
MHPVSIALLLAPTTARPIARCQVSVYPKVNPKICSPSRVVGCLGIAICNPATVDNGTQSPYPLSRPKQTPPPTRRRRRSSSRRDPTEAAH